MEIHEVEISYVYGETFRLEHLFVEQSLMGWWVWEVSMPLGYGHSSRTPLRAWWFMR